MRRFLANVFYVIFLAAFGYLVIGQISSGDEVVNQGGVRIKYTNKSLADDSKKGQDFDQSFSGMGYAIDGDSLKIAGHEVRLFGIDAPEYSQKCLDGSGVEYSCGLMAKKFTADLIKGKEVTCYYHYKDVYNRYLAKCYVDEVEVNKELLRNGMAIIYSYSASDSDAKELEDLARDKKIGIWQGAFENPKDYRRKHPRKSSLKI